MNTLKKLLVVGAFALIPLVSAGCSCIKGDCPPPPVAEAPAPAPAPAPVAVVPPPAPVVTGNFCQYIPYGTAIIYSDPPTVTYGVNGEVINRTPVTFKPVAGAARAPAPQGPAVSAYDVPRSANVRTS